LLDAFNVLGLGIDPRRAINIGLVFGEDKGFRLLKYFVLL
jgi:hypothetical protein